MSNRSVTTTATTATATSIKNKTEQIINPTDRVKMKSCPIENTFKIIGKKFTVLILRNMINGKQNRFNQLLNSIEQGNPKTLTIRLREMEKSGLIKRSSITMEYQ